MKKLLLAVLTATLTLSIFCFAGCKHECVYNQQVASETYLVSAATRTNPAVYSKSCKCGKINENVEETFEYGEPTGHSFTNYVLDNNSTAETIGTKTAVCDHGCGATDSIADDAITFKTCTFEGLTSTKTVRNSVTEFDFNEEITINCNSAIISFVESACSSSVIFNNISYKTNNLIELSVFFDITSLCIKFIFYNRKLPDLFLLYRLRLLAIKFLTHFQQKFSR